MSRKRITSFIVLLVALFMSTSAFAQLAELKDKRVKFGTAVTEIKADNAWYLLYKGNALLQPNEAPLDGGFMFNNWDGASEDNDGIRVNDALVDKSVLTNRTLAAHLVRFVSTGEANCYKIQFGNGRWLKGPNALSNNWGVKGTGLEGNIRDFLLYSIAGENAAAFGFNIWKDGDDHYGMRIKGAPASEVLVLGEGQHTDLSDEPTIWNIVSVSLEDVSAHELAYLNLLNVYDEYFPYYDAFTPGTEPGQYGIEEVAAFRAALDAVYDLDDPDVDIDSMTAEEFNRMADAIKAAYEAVVNSRVSYTMANGYYRLKTGLVYTNTVQDEETGESVSKVFDKYMYVTSNNGTLNAVWGNVEDFSSHAPSLWKLTDKGSNNFELENTAYDAQFNKSTGTSANFTLQTDSTELMYIMPAQTVDGVTYVNIRAAAQTGDYTYLHQGGHGGGSGVSGNVVAWSAKEGTGELIGGSLWIFEAVSEEEAQAIIDAYAPIKDREAMLAAYDSLMTNAKANLKIAKDDQHVNLITSVEQLSSPYTDPTEGAIANLIDGNSSTYWHSTWQGGNVDNGLHYLQIALAEPVDEDVYITFTRRNAVINDHLTRFSVYGSNNPEGEKSDWTLLAEFNTPYGDATETIVTDPFALNGCTYLRMYEEATTNDRGYWHISELQISYAIVNEHPQSSALGDLYTNLETVVNELSELETDDVTIDEYNRLKTAYDAFMAKFVDPTELRDSLARVKDVYASIRTDKSDPGFWANEDAGKAFQTTYDAAVAYDASGVYTAEQSKDYAQKVIELSNAVYASAIKIQEGKWYRIRFPEEEDFEEYNWDKVAGNGSTREDGTETVPSLFGKYLSAAYLCVEASQAADGSTFNVQSIEAVDPDTVVVGNKLHVIDEYNMGEYTDNALFRFIAVGDSAYMLQNKGTGLFVKAGGSTGEASLSAHPTLFNVNAIGYGLNAIHAESLTGENQNYLHIQVSGNVLVTWGVNTVGSRSALYIEDAEEAVANDYDGTAFKLSLNPGSISMHCFPVGISVAEGTDAQMWTVDGIKALEEDSLSLSISLAQIEGNTVPGGRPFILVYGDTAEYSTLDADLVAMQHDYTIGHTVPETNHPLIGTYYATTQPAGVLMAKGNAIVVNKSNTALAANSAYINAGWNVKTNAKVEVILDDAAADGIQTALQNVSKSGAVYTIDGRLVSKKATLNDLQKFGKGIYILNGTKVIVK